MSFHDDSVLVTYAGLINPVEVAMAEAVDVIYEVRDENSEPDDGAVSGGCAVY